MRTRMRLTACILLFLAACSASAVQAGTYTFTIPENPSSLDFDFGMQFSNIQGVSISWSGVVNTGWWEDPVWGGSVWPGVWGVDLWKDYIGYTNMVYSNNVMGWEYPATMPFEDTQQFSLARPSEGWSFLLDGKGRIMPTLFAFDQTGIPPSQGIVRPTGTLGAITLTIQGTAVPEPSSLSALIGVIGLGAVALRRRK